MLQFLQCKTFGNQAVPAGWVIVAAGNPPEYNKSVRDFDIVTLDRAVSYTHLDVYKRQVQTVSSRMSTISSSCSRSIRGFWVRVSYSMFSNIRPR